MDYICDSVYICSMFWFFIITAEFIIALAEKNDCFDAFKKVLVENGAEFSVSRWKFLNMWT